MSELAEASAIVIHDPSEASVALRALTTRQREVFNLLVSRGRLGISPAGRGHRSVAYHNPEPWHHVSRRTLEVLVDAGLAEWRGLPGGRFGAVARDVSSSASRQHFIDTGAYLAIDAEREDYSWEEVAERGHLCPSSPGWAGPHVSSDDPAKCDECGASLEPPATVTVTLTVAQAAAIVEFADLGIDEKRYDIDENHPYTEEEEADALAACDTAETAMSIITAALTRHTEQENTDHA